MLLRLQSVRDARRHKNTLLRGAHSAVDALFDAGRWPISHKSFRYGPSGWRMHPALFHKHRVSVSSAPTACGQNGKKSFWPGRSTKALGSVSRILYGIAAVAIIRLGGALPRRSSDLPGRLANRAGSQHCDACASQYFRPYLVLLRVGFAMQRSLLNARCALTAPFHPYLLRGGIFSVALSVGRP